MHRNKKNEIKRHYHCINFNPLRLYLFHPKSTFLNLKDYVTKLIHIVFYQCSIFKNNIYYTCKVTLIEILIMIQYTAIILRIVKQLCKRCATCLEVPDIKSKFILYISMKENKQ